LLLRVIYLRDLHKNPSKSAGIEKVIADNEEIILVEDHKEIEKRKVFLGYGELLYLKNNGGIPLQELNVETLTGFSNISGNNTTDSWIRREINEAKNLPRPDKNVKERTLTGMIGEIKRYDNYIFVTRDLVSSLSAISENIDTIFISRIENWQKRLRKGNLNQVSRLLLTMAVLSEFINVEINDKKLELHGMWKEKTVFDWSVENVRLIKNE